MKNSEPAHIADNDAAQARTRTQANKEIHQPIDQSCTIVNNKNATEWHRLRAKPLHSYTSDKERKGCLAMPACGGGVIGLPGWRIGGNKQTHGNQRIKRRDYSCTSE
jgi:hypothetical protein